MKSLKKHEILLISGGQASNFLGEIYDNIYVVSEKNKTTWTCNLISKLLTDAICDYASANVPTVSLYLAYFMGSTVIESFYRTYAEEPT